MLLMPPCKQNASPGFQIAHRTKQHPFQHFSLGFTRWLHWLVCRCGSRWQSLLLSQRQLSTLCWLVLTVKTDKMLVFYILHLYIYLSVESHLLCWRAHYCIWWCDGLWFGPLCCLVYSPVLCYTPFKEQSFLHKWNAMFKHMLWG